MSVYSQFLTPVDAVTVNHTTLTEVGSVVDFGVVYSGFTAFASIDPSSADDATVVVDTSIDDVTWLSAPSADVGVGDMAVVAVPAGRYVRVKSSVSSEGQSSILTVQVAVEG
jgi:hypothetical protein